MPLKVCFQLTGTPNSGMANWVGRLGYPDTEGCDTADEVRAIRYAARQWREGHKHEPRRNHAEYRSARRSDVRSASKGVVRGGLRGQHRYEKGNATSDPAAYAKDIEGVDRRRRSRPKPHAASYSTHRTHVELAAPGGDIRGGAARVTSTATRTASYCDFPRSVLGQRHLQRSAYSVLARHVDGGSARVRPGRPAHGLEASLAGGDRGGVEEVRDLTSARLVETTTRGMARSTPRATLRGLGVAR